MNSLEDHGHAGAVRLELGGVTFNFIPTNDCVKPRPGEFYRPFISDSDPDITLFVHYGPAPYEDLGPVIFDSGGKWVLHRTEDKLIIFIRQGFSSAPHQIVALDTDLKGGDIYCMGDYWTTHDLSSLGYPLEEVLVVNVLAQGRGVLLHASAVSDGGRGILFSGASGAGKSTMAIIWERQDDVEALSDDRVIVRKHGDRFWGYGTPWHGTARMSSPNAAPIDRIFLIHHAEKNSMVPLSPMDAASRLLVRSFPTFWDKQGMEFTLAFLDELAQTVPCYELGFVPNEEIVEIIRCASSQ